MSRRRFYETVAAATKDFARHGYDSQERLDHWRRLIEAAAAASFVHLDEIEKDVRKTMNLAYYRMVTKGGLLRRMPQIGAYTLQRLTPALQSELNRRIISSIDLIKLNRPVAIAKTVQRFTGWAISVPEGGFPSDIRKGAYKYTAVKADVQKAMTSLPFEERRVIIDQNAKMISAISAVAAEGGGAIAAVWESHKHQKNYDGRPAHNKRDGQMFLLRDNWAIEKGLVKRGAGEYTDSIEQPGEFVFCFPGDTLVNYASNVKKGYRRFYSGKMTTIIMASGKTLRATPNHPILTSKGWIAAGALNEGDYVVEVADQETKFPETNINTAPPMIADCFSTLSMHFNATKETGTEKQFHGDGGKSDVDIIDVAGELPYSVNTLVSQGCDQIKFAKANNFVHGVCAFSPFIMARACSFSRGMCSLRNTLSSFFSDFLHTQAIRLTGITYDASGATYSGDNASTCYIKFIRQGKNAFSVFMQRAKGGIANTYFSQWFLNCFFKKNLARVMLGPQSAFSDAESFSDVTKKMPFQTQLSEVVLVNNDFFTGHVFNLETSGGWYITNNIVVHNCRCSWVYIFNVRDLPDDWLTVKGKEQLAEAKRKTKELLDGKP